MYLGPYGKGKICDLWQSAYKDGIAFVAQYGDKAESSYWHYESDLRPPDDEISKMFPELVEAMLRYDALKAIK